MDEPHLVSVKRFPTPVSVYPGRGIIHFVPSTPPNVVVTTRATRSAGPRLRTHIPTSSSSHPAACVGLCSGCRHRVKRLQYHELSFWHVLATPSGPLHIELNNSNRNGDDGLTVGATATRHEALWCLTAGKTEREALGQHSQEEMLCGEQFRH